MNRIPSSSSTNAIAPSSEPQMVASPPKITMATSSMDSSRMNELGSTNVVQLENSPPASPAIIADMVHTASL